LPGRRPAPTETDREPERQLLFRGSLLPESSHGLAPAGGDAGANSGPDRADFHSVRDLLQAAFHQVGIEDWEPYVVQDERFFRPADVAVLSGDAAKAHTKLGWHPTVDFQQLIKMMVAADLEHEKVSSAPVPE
jgi:UDP-glucose 4-epimerase